MSFQIYIAEIAQPQHRGWLGGMTTPVLALGSVLSYILGALVSWHYVAILGAIIPLSMILGLLYLHDSPYWYLQNGDEKKALKVMEAFRSSESNCLGELLAISDTFQTSADEYSTKEAVKNLTRRQYRRPFLILNFLFILMTFSGNFAITFYAVDVFKQVGAGHINEYLSAVIAGLIKLLGSLIYIPAVKYLSRRVLICSSSLVMGISLSILGLAMYSHETGLIASLDHISWLPLICVTVYMLADPIGLGSVPFLYVAEFFPSEMRSLLSGITIGLANLELFIVVKTFPNLNAVMGSSGTFWLYAGCCFATIVFTLLTIPETKGRTLEDIEEYFSHKESLYVTPLPTPVGTPATTKRGLAPYPHLSIQFTL
jgi:facilitated trehalose transporter